jgi:hypothetical protein
MAKQKTPNGIEFEFELAGESGARYYLTPHTSQNNKSMILEAKAYIRANFDAVSIYVEPIVHNKKRG